MLGLPLIAAVLAVSQGQAVRLEVAHEPGLESVEVSWAGRDVPFVRRGDAWVTAIGVDLEAAPGDHGAEIALRFAEGRAERRTETLRVRGVDFPTTALTVEPRYVEPDPEEQARAARESQEIAAVYARLTPEAYWDEPFAVPIPGATGGRNFGHRRVFNGQPRAPHSGADLRAATGTPIHASNRGRVVLAKDLFFSGNAVFIDHGLGVYSVYLHLSEIQVEPGEMVERGQVVGLAGATGRVTGPHLHWGARLLDARVDPFSLLDLVAEGDE
jgi:murein DD-endopeptidase MepM/ murein hydrolase activator NlpD